jgi:hypothetical protein
VRWSRRGCGRRPRSRSPSATRLRGSLIYTGPTVQILT